MELTPQALRELADQMEAKKTMPPVADIGSMSLAECGKLLQELFPDRHISVAVEVDFMPHYGRFNVITPASKVNVKLWDGIKFHEGPTVEAAYETLRMAYLPAETRPEVADAMIEDLRAKLEAAS